MGCAEDIQVQLALPRRSHIESGMHEEAVKVWVSDDLLFDTVTPFGIGVGDLEAQARGFHAVEVRLHMAPLIVEESLSVADQVLNVPHLGSVDSGVVELGDDTVRHG